MTDHSAEGIFIFKAHFLINPPGLITEVKIRLDVYRSITVIRKLIELGVPKEQLMGGGKRIRLKEEDPAYYRVYISRYYH